MKLIKWSLACVIATGLLVIGGGCSNDKEKIARLEQQIAEQKAANEKAASVTAKQTSTVIPK